MWLKLIRDEICFSWVTLFARTFRINIEIGGGGATIRFVKCMQYRFRLQIFKLASDIDTPLIPLLCSDIGGAGPQYGL